MQALDKISESVSDARKCKHGARGRSNGKGRISFGTVTLRVAMVSLRYPSKVNDNDLQRVATSSVYDFESTIGRVNVMSDPDRGPKRANAESDYSPPTADLRNGDEVCVRRRTWTILATETFRVCITQLRVPYVVNPNAGRVRNIRRCGRGYPSAQLE